MTSYEYTCIPIWFLVQVPSSPQTLTSCTAQLWIPSDQEIRNAIITIPITETGHAQKKTQDDLQYHILADPTYLKKER